jgi:glycosyltransferase involved in cell wall biosynthesis
MIGIGIVTYNREASLRECVANIERHTRQPYALVVADDGSTDGTPEWLAERGTTFVGGPNRGVARNKNRALWHLMQRPELDPIILFEDDTHPVLDGWDYDWCAMIARWGHLNCYPYWSNARAIRDAAPHPSDPRVMVCRMFGGPCTGTSRAMMDRVGYLDPRFGKFWEEHCEWTWRFEQALAPGWDLGRSLFPTSRHGLEVNFVGSYYNYYGAEERARNLALKLQIMAQGWDGRPVMPWRDEAQKAEFLAEQKAFP